MQFVQLKDGAAESVARRWPINQILLENYVCRSIRDDTISVMHKVTMDEVKTLRIQLEILSEADRVVDEMVSMFRWVQTLWARVALSGVLIDAVILASMAGIVGLALLVWMSELST